jgi:hypothetical protein
MVSRGRDCLRLLSSNWIGSKVYQKIVLVNAFELTASIETADIFVVKEKELDKEYLFEQNQEDTDTSTV